MSITPVKGTRDFYPEEMAKREWIFTKFRESAGLHNFEEYDSCVLEHEELYVRKAGDEITGQLYSFTDKGNRRLTLRPEMTPSLVRMVIAREKSLQFPLKWFSIPQCFRYEKMQKGRKREHFQWNMDIIGDPSLNAEAELFSAIIYMCESAGLTEKDIQIRVNNRKILQEVFSNIGLDEAKFDKVYVIIDKREKIGDENVELMLREAGVDAETASKIISFLKAETEEEIIAVNGSIPRGLAEVYELFRICELHGIRKYLDFDVSIIRGLSYYTGIVFELFSISGRNRAVAGGGRYDHLMETLGGSALPMVGFGFGDVVISDILEEKNLFPPDGKRDVYYVIAFSEGEKAAAVKTAARLRRNGKNTEIDLSCRKLKKMLSRADKLGFEKVVIAAPEELKSGRVILKNLAANSSELIEINKLGT